MKPTFDEFIAQNPTWKDFSSNADAEIVFSILSRKASVESMISAISEEKPALTPCVLAVEELLEDMPKTTMPIDVKRNRQAVGLMAKSILAAYGYEPIRDASGDAKTKPLPSESRARYFEEAAVYKKV